MSKYSPLKDFLQNSYNTTVVLTFQEIEEILGFSLCNSAYIHSAWWANDTTNHIHAKAWLEAGWLVDSPTEAIHTNRVTFIKIINKKRHEKEYKQEKTNEYRQPFTTLQEFYTYFNCPYASDEKQMKLAYWKMIGKYHPDKVNAMGPEIIKQAEEKTKEINDMYEKYQEARLEELRREELERQERERHNQEKAEQERLEKEELERSYFHQESYNYYDTERKTQQESGYHQFEVKNFLIALIVSIAAVAFFGNIMQGCPSHKEPNRTPSPKPKIEYVLPKADGSFITVKSDVLTEYFGIPYEQRQKSNLFMKDAYEYRYNGNGTWTITKKSAINNTNKNYIDTNNKAEVENYLHSLGF